MTRRVLIALTSHDRKGDTGEATGYYVSEAADSWDVFRQAGFEVDLVSVAGGKPPRDGFDPDDEVQRRFTDELATELLNTPRPNEVDSDRYDAIFFAGGHGTMWDFPGDAGLERLARGIYESGGVVAAVCHGPAALTELKLTDGSFLVAGKQLTSFTDSEESAVGLTDVVPFLLATRLTERGAQHSAAPDFQLNVVVDGRLVTGQNPASSAAVARETVGVVTRSAPA